MPTRARRRALSTSAHSHAGHNPYLAHHFESMEQQKEAATLGMWLFLAQEVMFFGGLFCAYAVNRFMYPDAWSMGSGSLSIPIGAFNTVVLLLSSFTVALAVYNTQIGNSKRVVYFLILTLVLGITFVTVKWIWEYSPKIDAGVFPGSHWGPNPADHHYGKLASFAQQGPLELFFFMYFLMTGMHAFHMIIGFAILLVLIPMAWMDKFGPQRYMTIMNFGLYWHFVDIVWVFLFPMYYLIPQAGGH
ncbi:MAG: cytochrome c oxidase subunit 3 [Candidatus Hydrogenedentes bacterium]|nr:cytochrome c oxidase subunit 3 [Candidatus Hydrogenedentota bacterium]